MKVGDLVYYASPAGSSDFVPGIVLEIDDPWATVQWVDMPYPHLVVVNWLIVVGEANLSGSR